MSANVCWQQLRIIQALRGLFPDRPLLGSDAKLRIARITSAMQTSRYISFCAAVSSAVLDSVASPKAESTLCQQERDKLCLIRKAFRAEDFSQVSHPRRRPRAC